MSVLLLYRPVVGLGYFSLSHTDCGLMTQATHLSTEHFLISVKTLQVLNPSRHLLYNTDKNAPKQY